MRQNSAAKWAVIRVGGEEINNDAALCYAAADYTNQGAAFRITMGVHDYEGGVFTLSGHCGTSLLNVLRIVTAVLQRVG